MGREMIDVDASFIIFPPLVFIWFLSSFIFVYFPPFLCLSTSFEARGAQREGYGDWSFIFRRVGLGRGLRCFLLNSISFPFLLIFLSSVYFHFLFLAISFFILFLISFSLTYFFSFIIFFLSFGKRRFIFVSRNPREVLSSIVQSKRRCLSIMQP